MEGPDYSVATGGVLRATAVRPPMRSRALGQGDDVVIGVRSPIGAGDRPNRVGDRLIVVPDGVGDEHGSQRDRTDR